MVCRGQNGEKANILSGPGASDLLGSARKHPMSSRLNVRSDSAVSDKGFDRLRIWTQSKSVDGLEDRLRRHGVLPSAQRLAVASYVLTTDEHPSADRVWERAREALPMISRATVYNTLNLFVAKGLLRSFVLGGDRLVFDPKLEPHHHLVDETTGRIHDVAWSALEVRRVDEIPGYDVDGVEVVLRGRPRGSRRGIPSAGRAG